MKRFASQWLLFPDLTVLRNFMIEIAGNNEIVQLKDLNGVPSETAGTVFLNGVIAPAIFSLSMRDIPDEQVFAAGTGLYRAENGRFVELYRGKSGHCVIDFGTEDLVSINAIIRSNEAFLREISLERFIHACTYAPASLLQNDINISVGASISLTVWENVDFINHCLTVSSLVKTL